ncbi:MAG: GEVED domain-containing protein [Chloroflexota bacterium]
MRKFWRTFPYLLVILVQLIQPISSLADNLASPSGLPGTESANRPPWNRPGVQRLRSPLLNPLPRQNSTVDIPPPSPDLLTSTAPAALPTPFPLGNNNFGQPYKDTNNPEDHPGRHFAGPVNLINGNLFLTVGDHFFADRGLSVQFARAYNSLDLGSSGPLGVGWTHSFNITAEELSPFEVIIREADGSQTLYTRPIPSGPWTPPPGVHRELLHEAFGDPYLLRYKNGLFMEFDPLGQLVSIMDRNNNAIQLSYDASSRLTGITGPSGINHLTLAYDPADRISAVTDPLGRVTTYTYDPTTNTLVDVLYPEGSHAAYTYDPTTLQMVAYTDPRQARGTTHADIIYNAASQRVQRVQYQIDSFFDVFYNPGMTVWEDGLGIDSSVQYDGSFNVTFDGTWMGTSWVGENWLYSPDLLATLKIDPDGFPTNFTYDSLGNLLTVTSAMGGVTKYRYETTYSNVISTTNPLSATALFDYDANGNLIKETRADGSVTSYTIDPFGNPISVTDNAGVSSTYSYDPVGNLISTIDANGNTTTHTYDAAGRVTQTVDPLMRATSYTYDAADRLVQLTDPGGGTIEYTYDARSNLLKLTNANGKIYNHTYDTLDRLVKVQDPLGFTTAYTYDGNSRLVKRQDASGMQTKYTYDNANRMVERLYPSGRIDHFVYDNRGNMILADSGAFATSMTYDAESHLLTVNLISPTFTGVPQITYSYDPLGNRIQSSVSDGLVNYQTHYIYDAVNRLVQSADSDGRIWTTTYNVVGRRDSLTLPDGGHVEYAYDDFGNLLQQNHFDPSNALIRSFTYSYDGVGNTIGETDDALFYNYSYDPLNRLITANTPTGNASFTYDPASNLLTAVSAAGVNNFTYDPSNHRTSSSDSTYIYDGMGRRIGEFGPRGALSYSYDAEMRLTQVNHPDGALKLEYDALGQLLMINDGSTARLHLRSQDRLEGELDDTGHLLRAYTIDTEIIAMKRIGAPSSFFDIHYNGHGRARWVTDAAAGDTVAEYSDNPAEDYPGFYNPIRLQGAYFIPEIGMYYVADGQVWDPYSGLFLWRFRPWVFWPYGPFFSWWSIFHWWPWPWPWPRPWGWAWPRPWPFWWPWPGVWVRPFLIWPFWPWPIQPFLPWWWYWHWWGWTPWGHWWWWHRWWWYDHWWFWGWWCGWCWWWPYWWWHWLWWWPCWWIWWVWWGWWGHWWWCWFWWWPWHWPWWGWWWPIYWLPVMPRPPDYGDAADPLYPSLLANNGPRHLDTSYEWLGASASREYNALLTDVDTFDDGVVTDLLAGVATGVVTITVSTSGALWRYDAARPLNLHGWFDWNGDGDWYEPGEFVINWSGYPGDGVWPPGMPSTTLVFAIVVPNNTANTIWTRFRLDYIQNIEAVNGPANFGEVEDYRYSLYRIRLPLVFWPAP